MQTRKLAHRARKSVRSVVRRHWITVAFRRAKVWEPARCTALARVDFAWLVDSVRRDQFWTGATGGGPSSVVLPSSFGDLQDRGARPAQSYTARRALSWL
uniref:BRCT domain-containing protein n=1 Tax=Trichuris muris TaxID=70415 RepID=A0A5S6QAF1_TRIMR